MKIFDCIQGTAEWLEIRAGIPSASQFSKIITPKTMKPSESATPYMYSLLAERIMGRPLVEHVSFWMERGSEMEREAVDFYEFQRDVQAKTVGFITNDAETIGASPDRLIDESGLLEIKCPSPAQHIQYLLWKSVDRAYYPQVMGQLWVTGRQWVDVLSYHPEMPPALIRVERDEEYIENLAKLVTAFSNRLEGEYLVLIERGIIAKPQPSQPDGSQRNLIETMRQAMRELNRERETVGV